MTDYNVTFHACNGTYQYLSSKFLEFSFAYGNNQTITNLQCVDLCRTHATMTIGGTFVAVLWVMSSLIITMALIAMLVKNEKMVRVSVIIMAAVWCLCLIALL